MFWQRLLRRSYITQQQGKSAKEPAAEDESSASASAQRRRDTGGHRKQGISSLVKQSEGGLVEGHSSKQQAQQHCSEHDRTVGKHRGNGGAAIQTRRTWTWRRNVAVGAHEA